MYARVYSVLLHIYLTLFPPLEIKIALKFRAKIARTVVQFRPTKKEVLLVHGVIARSRGSRDDPRQRERIHGNLYHGDDKISVSPPPRVPLANSLLLLISSPLASEEHSFARPLFSYPPSTINPKRVTATDTPKGENKRFVAAAHQEPP